MAKPISKSCLCAAVCLAAAAAQGFTLPAQAQFSDKIELNPPQQAQLRENRDRTPTDRLPSTPSLPAAFTIPVEPLGFSTPGPIYIGIRNSLVSLDFFDEDHLLFTFRVPGLMRRDAGESVENEQRQIRAVVLILPEGKVGAEALWTVHDRVRYLWMLKDGHFLLRDQDTLQQGDAKLELKPLLQFPGPLLWLELDPSEQFLVTNSHEPAGETAKPGQVPSPASARADLVTGEQNAIDQMDLVVRILRRESGKVMLVSRARSSVHLPINPDGYLEALRGNGMDWLLNLNYFRGGSKVLGHIESNCVPAAEFVSQRELLASACAKAGGSKLTAFDTDGRRLWEELTSSTAVWPLTVMAPNGLRLARETLAVNRPMSASFPLDSDDIRGQLVRVIDAANGNVVLEEAVSPVLDSGGNVAISPSGKRVAILNKGAIQVFELPPAPPLSNAATEAQTR